MSGGYVKQDEIKVEDTNMAGVGSAEDKAVRKSAAEKEKAWEGAGKAPGKQVWRIEKFQVVPWPEKEYGNFYTGDAYIVLKTTKDPESEKLNHDIHFWLGSKCSIDEQGTAAYKTVELDDLMDGDAVQHREVEGYESREFHAIFPTLHYLEGGVDSGFHHVGPDAFEARLYQVRKIDKATTVQQVPLTKDSMNCGDCFILDTGDKLLKYYGSEASAFEKQRCGTAAENMEGARFGKAKAMDYTDDVKTFWELLGGEGPIKAAAEGKPAVRGRASILGGDEASVGDGVIYKLSDDSGKLRFQEKARGSLSMSMCESTNVYVVDVVSELFIWVGKKASKDETQQAMPAAVHHLEATSRPIHTGIKMFKEGQAIKNAKWKAIMK